MKRPDFFIKYLMIFVSLVERSTVSAFPPQSIPQESSTKSHTTINFYGIYLSTYQFLLRHNLVNGTGKPVSEVLSDFFGTGRQTRLFVNSCCKKIVLISFKEYHSNTRKHSQQNSQINYVITAVAIPLKYTFIFLKSFKIFTLICKYNIIDMSLSNAHIRLKIL